MKKYLIPILVVLLSIGLLMFRNYNLSSQIDIIDQPTGYETRVTLTIDFGNKEIKNFRVITNSDDTAFSILKATLEKEEIKIETIQYDFGVFVKKIGDFESTTKKSWIYYVNSESGSVAADTYKIKNEDKILWKYEVPKL